MFKEKQGQVFNQYATNPYDCAYLECSFKRIFPENYRDSVHTQFITTSLEKDGNDRQRCLKMLSFMYVMNVTTSSM